MREQVRMARMKAALDNEVRIMNRTKTISPTMMTVMAANTMSMRPQLNDNQAGEVINRALAEFETHTPNDFDEVIMRLEFHADDVLGHSDEEYAYTGDE
tara:strand:+ start:70 stop:366 length:297 start_codon:yes stop_codon:yes gene_type:complete